MQIRTNLRRPTDWLPSTGVRNTISAQTQFYWHFHVAFRRMLLMVMAASSCNAGLRSRLPHVHLYGTNHRQHCTRTAIQRPGNPRITLLTCSVQYSPNKLYNSSSDRRSRGRPTVSYLQPFSYSQASPNDIVFIATLMPQHDESMCL